MNERKVIFLIHGLARSPRSFRKLEKELLNAGYRVHNLAYPSTRFNIQTLATEYILPQIQSVINETSEHAFYYITHSMGGIILRYLAKHNMIPKPQAAVMLGPPNQGSEVVDVYQRLSLFRWRPFEWLNGPAGIELHTGKSSVPNALGAVGFSCGIIASNRSINFILSLCFKGKPNDGKVSVERTKVEGMTSHIVVSSNHPMMMRNKKVIEQALYFLEHLTFNLGS